MSVVLYTKQNSESIVTIYSDINSNPVDNGTPIAINLKAIQQSLDNLFSTRKYERPFEPEYYSPIYDVIGELATSATAAALSSAIYRKIQRFEPRIIYDNAASIIEPGDDANSYIVDIVFRMAGGIDSNSYNYNVRLHNTIT